VGKLRKLALMNNSYALASNRGRKEDKQQGVDRASPSQLQDVLPGVSVYAPSWRYHDRDDGSFGHGRSSDPLGSVTNACALPVFG